jgi:hypothetical protein
MSTMEKKEAHFMRVLQAILQFLYEVLLGCRHGRLTRPFTIEQQTYKVCLDCGKQIYYSANTMRPLNGGELRRMRAAQAGEVKILPGTAEVGALRSESQSKAIA